MAWRPKKTRGSKMAGGIEAQHDGARRKMAGRFKVVKRRGDGTKAGDGTEAGDGTKAGDGMNVRDGTEAQGGMEAQGDPKVSEMAWKPKETRRSEMAQGLDGMEAKDDPKVQSNMITQTDKQCT